MMALLVYFVAKYNQNTGNKLEGKEHSKVFFSIFVIFMMYKFFLFLSFAYANNVNFIKQVLPTILSSIVAIFMGIWMGNSDLSKIEKTKKVAKAYSTSNEIEANKLVEILGRYNIDASIDKSNLTSFNIMVKDNIEFSKVLEIINLYSTQTIAIAKGEYKPKEDEPKVWFESIKSLTDVLNNKNPTFSEIH